MLLRHCLSLLFGLGRLETSGSSLAFELVQQLFFVTVK
jgi:hypothetical protein